MQWSSAVYGPSRISRLDRQRLAEAAFQPDGKGERDHLRQGNPCKSGVEGARLLAAMTGRLVIGVGKPARPI